MPQSIAYTIDYKAERDMALEEIQDLKETIKRLKNRLAIAEEKIRASPFVM
jgi:hypothetical protein